MKFILTTITILAPLIALKAVFGQDPCAYNEEYRPAGKFRYACGLDGFCPSVSKEEEIECPALSTPPIEVISATQQVFGHSTSTSATCGKLGKVKDVLLNPTEYNGVLVSMRHPTTDTSQANLEVFGCYEANDLTSTCIRGVDPSISGTDSNEWFVTDATEGDDCWKVLGSQCNGQRHIEVTGVKEQHLIGKAMKNMNLNFASITSSSWDRCYNGARIIADATGGTAKPTWEMTLTYADSGFINSPKVYDIFTITDQGPQSISTLNPLGAYNAEMTQQINVLNSFVEAVIESKATNEPTYINHHGGHVFKTHNINQERGVTNIVLGTSATYQQDTYLLNSEGDFTRAVYHPGQLQPNAFQLSPSAWVAMDSCNAMESDYDDKKVENVLTAMDLDSNFEVSRSEFLVQCPQKEFLFDALDMEGSTFAEDTLFCEKNGCVRDDSGSWTHPTDSKYAEFCSHCDAQRKPAVIAGDKKISIGVMEELRNNNPRASYPWGYRQILALTQELPKDIDDLLALYEPEGVLVNEACTKGVDVTSYVALLQDHSPISSTEFKTLFANVNIHEVEALLSAYETEECPSTWRGDYITREEGQLAPGLSHYMDVDDSIPNFNGVDSLRVGDIWPSMSVPAITGKYFNGKVRLAAKLLEDELLSFDQVTKLFCAYEKPTGVLGSSYHKIEAKEGGCIGVDNVLENGVKLMMTECKEDDESMYWHYDLATGLIHSKVDPSYCWTVERGRNIRTTANIIEKRIRLFKCGMVEMDAKQHFEMVNVEGFTTIHYSLDGRCVMYNSANANIGDFIIINDCDGIRKDRKYFNTW